MQTDNHQFNGGTAENLNSSVTIPHLQDPITAPETEDNPPFSSDTLAPSSPQHHDQATSHPSPNSTLKPPSQTPTPNPRLLSLLTRKSHLESKLSNLRTQHATFVSDAALPSGLAMPATWTDEQKAKQALVTANAVVKEHITLLHRYNEMKDIGLGLLGLVAEKRGTRVATVMEEFGMSSKD